MIKIFGFETCPYCTQLKNLLETDGTLYTYVDITLEGNKDEYHRVATAANCEDLPLIQVNHHLLIPEVSFKSILDIPKLIKRLLD